MRILFMGTPDFALEILKKLWESGEEIVGAVTQPDKPKGRGYKMIPPPVKVFAEEKGIPVFQPETLRGGAFEKELSELSPGMIVVAAYGKILPEYIIDYPKYGCINAHGSLLPKYRGAAPIQRAILDGEKKTGVTAMYMDKGLDTGDMILAEEVEITDDDNFETLHDKMAAAGADAILKTIRLAKAGDVPRVKQDGDKATYAEKITREDRILDFSDSAPAVHNRIRALSPFPRAFTVTPEGKMLQITKAELVSGEGEAGRVVSFDKYGFTVACGEGCIRVLEVIPEGRGKMKAADFVNGRGISVGCLLGAKNEDK